MWFFQSRYGLLSVSCVYINIENWFYHCFQCGCSIFRMLHYCCLIMWLSLFTLEERGWQEDPHRLEDASGGAGAERSGVQTSEGKTGQNGDGAPEHSWRVSAEWWRRQWVLVMMGVKNIIMLLHAGMLICCLSLWPTPLLKVSPNNDAYFSLIWTTGALCIYMMLFITNMYLLLLSGWQLVILDALRSVVSLFIRHITHILAKEM